MRELDVESKAVIQLRHLGGSLGAVKVRADSLIARSQMPWKCPV
jgi:hypothetical protein